MESGAPNTEALRLEFDWWSTLAGARRDEMNSIVQQVAGAIAIAALVIGLFGAFRPGQTSALASGLFAGSLAPFVLIVGMSLFGPFVVVFEHERRTDLWFLAEDEARIEALGAVVTPQLTERVGRAITSGGPALYGTLLSEEDWLTLRTQQAAREAMDFEDTIRDARRIQLQITALLALEVAYLAIVTSITPFL